MDFKTLTDLEILTIAAKYGIPLTPLLRQNLIKKLNTQQEKCHSVISDQNNSVPWYEWFQSKILTRFL